MKRQRGRGRKPGGGGGGGGNPGNRPLESNGPDVKIRGTAAQIYEKYAQYARDAQSSGDRVKYENYLQHAEHYFRIMAATTPRDQRVPHGEIGMNGPPTSASDEAEGEEASPDALKVVDEANDDDGSDAFEGEDADGREDDGAEAAAGGDERPEGRGRRRRGRRRNGDGPRHGDGSYSSGDRQPGSGQAHGASGQAASGPGASGQGGGDTEARSALDSLARKQGALAGG
jgi:hypothetical protein